MLSAESQQHLRAPVLLWPACLADVLLQEPPAHAQDCLTRGRRLPMVSQLSRSAPWLASAYSPCSKEAKPRHVQRRRAGRGLRRAGGGARGGGRRRCACAPGNKSGHMFHGAERAVAGVLSAARLCAWRVPRWRRCVCWHSALRDAASSMAVWPVPGVAVNMRRDLHLE